MRFPHMLQSSGMACGTTSLAIILKYYGLGNQKQWLDEKAKLSKSGVTLYNISTLAQEYKLDTKGYELTVSELTNVKLPCILHFENNHFVVLYKIKKNHFYISDPAVGRYKLHRDIFTEKWNGVTLELNPTNNFREQDTKQKTTAFSAQYQKLKFKPFVDFARNKKRLLLTLFALSLSIKVLYLVVPLLIKFIFDYGISLDLGGLFLLFCFALLAVSLIVAGFYSRDKLFSQIKFSFEHYYFSSLFDHIIRLKQKYFDRYKKEDIINRFSENNRLRSFLSARLLDSFFNSVFLLIYLLILFLLSPVLFVIASITIVVNLALVLYTAPIIINNENLVFHEKNKVLNIFLDSFLGLKNVKPLTAETYFSEKWDKSYRASLFNIFTSEDSVINQRILITSVALASRMFVIFSSILLIQKGLMTFGDFIAANTIYFMALGSVNELVYLRDRLIRINHSLERVTDFFVKEIEEEKKPIALKQPATIKKLRISELSFSYDEDTEVLKDVSFSFYQGKKYGIVGKNGSGKTTLVKLLIRLYDHYEGHIFVNEINIAQLKKRALRKNVFYFPSEVYLFDDSIRNNLLIAKPEATDHDLYTSLELAGLKELVDSFFLGLDHRVGDRGMKLSTGQKLRFGFARLFLSNPSVIILDEATSSLDPEAEKTLLQNIYSHFINAIVISIAHRIHVLKYFDEILVLDEGKLIEHGSHEELLAKVGMYKHFVYQSN